MIAKRHTLANALRNAAASYNDIAFDASCHPGQERLQVQFENQAKEASALADAIEQSDTIRLED